jgi:hypothetical protein
MAKKFDIGLSITVIHTSAKRRNKKRSLRRWGWLVAIALLILAVCAVGAFFFVKKKGIFYSAPKEAVAPLPTGMDPNFMTQVNDCFLPVAALYGYTLRITAGFRSLAQQQQIYDQGRTTPGPIVTEAAPYQSIHNYGFAVDVVDRFRGYNIDWNKLIAIGAYCGLESGGPGDLPHFEHRGGLSTADFAAGKRPAPLTLPCPIMAERAEANEPLTLQDLQSCNAPTF